MTNLINENCNLCPRKCGIDRNKHLGSCHSTNDMRICRIAPHFYEEPPISGTLGSGTIFFSGCSLDCEFCQNFQISKSNVGKIYTPEQLALEIKLLENSGVHNINFVTPTHFSHKIRETLNIYRPQIPIVYNTSGYELPSIINEMNDYVDIYLVDMKYSNNQIAKKYSKINSYCDYCKQSIDLMVKNKPLIYDKNGLLKQGVIIRHLVLPENIDNTFGVIDFYKNYKQSALLSVMAQFVPTYKSSIKRILKPIEYKMIINYLIKNEINNCYIQELDSADVNYIPPFNLD